MAKLPILKILITVSVYCCVFSNGICSNIYGPTWLDLKVLMNTTLEKMSISISLRAAFFCAGALIGGFIYKLIDRGALYPLFILTKGLCVALIPLYANYNGFLVYSAIIGLVSGAADTSVNVWIIDIWKDRSAPFVQTLQFFWALGFILSPLISNPFLTPESILSFKNKKFGKFASTTTESPLAETTISHPAPADILSPEEHIKVVRDSELYIPYMIAGSICLIGSVSLLIIYIYRRIEGCALKNKLEEEEDNQINKVVQEDKKKSNDNYEDHPNLEYTKSKVYLVQVLLYCCIMTSVFCASEMTTFQYAPTFTVCLGYSKFTGSMLMTAIAISFAIGRFCGILLAIRFKPLYILWADWAIILIGNLILLLSYSNIKFLWLGSLLIGFGYSSFFAAIFSFLRERIVVNNFISSIVILSSLSGNAIGFPVFIGKYLDIMPLMMVYGNLFCSFVMFICLIGLLILDCKFGTKAKIIENLRKSQTHELVDKSNK